MRELRMDYTNEKPIHCPYCGRLGTLKEYIEGDIKQKSYKVRCMTPGCWANGANFVGYMSAELAIYDWNKRAVIPLDPILIEGGQPEWSDCIYGKWQCPKCESIFDFEEERFRYCPDCGQKIDWSCVEDYD